MTTINNINKLINKRNRKGITEKNRYYKNNIYHHHITHTHVCVCVLYDTAVWYSHTSHKRAWCVCV